MWLNKQGLPVKTQPLNMQIDIPAEEVGDASAALISIATNWVAISAAVMQMIFALMTGNTAAFMVALQALVNAIFK